MVPMNRKHNHMHLFSHHPRTKRPLTSRIHRVLHSNHFRNHVHFKATTQHQSTPYQPSINNSQNRRHRRLTPYQVNTQQLYTRRCRFQTRNLHIRRHVPSISTLNMVVRITISVKGALQPRRRVRQRGTMHTQRTNRPITRHTTRGQHQPSRTRHHHKVSNQGSTLHPRCPTINRFRTHSTPTFNIRHTYPTSNRSHTTILTSSNHRHINSVLHPTNRATNTFSIQVICRNIIMRQQALPGPTMRKINPNRGTTRRQINSTFTSRLHHQYARMFRPTKQRPSQAIRFGTCTISCLPSFITMTNSSHHFTQRRKNRIPPRFIMTIRMNRLSNSTQQCSIRHFIRQPCFRQVPSTRVIRVTTRSTTLLRTTRMIRPHISKVTTTTRQLRTTTKSHHLFSCTSTRPFTTRRSTTFRSTRPTTSSSCIRLLLRLVPIKSMYGPCSAYTHPYTPHKSPTPTYKPSTTIPTSE